MFAILILARGSRRCRGSRIEAAKVDGCTPWQSFRYVTWPFIMPFAYIAMTIRSPRRRTRLRHRQDHDRRRSARRTELLWTLIARTAYSDARMGAASAPWPTPRSRSRSSSPSAISAVLATARAQISRGVVKLTRNQTSLRLRRLADFAHSLGLFLAMAIIRLPGAWIVLSSMRPTVEIMAKPPVWTIPQKLSFEAYTAMFGVVGQGSIPVSGLFPQFAFIISITSTVIAIAIGMAGGYAFARYRFKRANRHALPRPDAGRAPCRDRAFAAPLHHLCPSGDHFDTRSSAHRHLCCAQRAVHDLADRWLLSPGAARACAEAAQIDGCTRWQAFWQVEFPLARPGIASSAIFAFMTSWNTSRLASQLAALGELERRFRSASSTTPPSSPSTGAACARSRS